MNHQGLLSIVVPVYSEEMVIPEFHSRTLNVLSGLAPMFDYEIIYVDDGSRDNSLALIRNLNSTNSRVRAISLSRNFGHQFAMSAGLDHARGDAIITIDGDLQDPPEIIPDMVAKWREGYRVVFGVREKRRGESLVKLLTAKLFYRLIRYLSDIDLPVDAGDFRLMDRKVVDVLTAMREENRYIRGLVSWAGFSQFGLPYWRDRRYAGKTKFSYKKMIRFGVDGILSFSDKPLKISAFVGSLMTVVSFIVALWVVINKLLMPHMVVSGWASMLLAVLFMGGIQLLSLGILGIYFGRQYREVKKRPLYVVAERIGFERDKENKCGNRDHDA